MPVYIRKNITKEKHTNISDEIKQLIAERNIFDIKLYNYVTEVFNNKIEENAEKIEKQLRTLHFRNSLYKTYHSIKTKSTGIFKKK